MLIKKEVNSIILLLILSFFILSSTLTISADSSVKTTTSGKYEILENIKKQHKDINSIKATVYQDKKLLALNKPLHVKGTIILQKPGILRWEAVTPERSTLVIDRNTITKYYPDTKEAEIHKLSDNFIARNTMVFFSSVMWGALDKMEKKFELDISRKNDEVIVELIPLSKIVSKYLSSVIIFYNERNGMPSGFEVETPKGDKTVTRLADIVMDPEIGADTFKLKFPADVRVRDYTEEIDFN